MKLSVVIVNYNVKYYLGQCLESLQRALKGGEAEVFVVDNHSHDGSVAYLRSRFPDVHFIASAHNLGFACGNNIAIRQSKGEYVLLLNPDTVVGEEVIHASIDFMDSHPAAGGHGVQMLTHCGERALESRRGLPSPIVSFYKMVGLCKHFPQSDRFAHYYMGSLSWDLPGKIEVISGAYCFLRRAALDKVGLLDEDFFMYGEDVDLSYRLLKGGFENWYLPVRILHYKGESTQKSSFRYVHVFYDAMLIFFRKHYPQARLWLSIPIKTAIVIKAIIALLQQQLRLFRKFLFPASGSLLNSYLYIGSHIKEIKALAERNGLELTCVDKVPDEIETKYTIVCFDTSDYSFSFILNFFSKSSHQQYIGLFYPEEKKLITGGEIFLYE